MNTEALARVSDVAVASAAVTYALGCLAHVVEWAFARQVAGESVPIGAAGPSAGRGIPPRSAVPTRSERLTGVALSLTVLATLLLVVAVFARGLAAGRVPWGSMYEFAVVGALAVALLHLGLISRLGTTWFGPVVTAFCTVVLGLSILVYVPAGPLVPALDSYWLVLHVAAALLAGAGFVVGAMVSAAYLLKDRAERRAPGGERGLLGRLPSPATLDQLAYRVHAFAFPVWTFAALIAGPIWAQYAWGRYWGWDPKEVWAFITFVVYAGYLHARATAGWRGRRAAVIALLGCATFLFSFTGINLFASGLHSYAF